MTILEVFRTVKNNCKLTKKQRVELNKRVQNGEKRFDDIIDSKLLQELKSSKMYSEKRTEFIAGINREIKKQL